MPRIQADFCGEASSELHIHKICLKNEDAFGLPPVLSHAILFMYMIDIEILEEYIKYACHISEFTKNCDRYMILYNLMLAHKYDLNS